MEFSFQSCPVCRATLANSVGGEKGHVGARKYPLSTSRYHRQQDRFMNVDAFLRTYARTDRALEEGADGGGHHRGAHHAQLQPPVHLCVWFA